MNFIKQPIFHLLIYLWLPLTGSCQYFHFIKNGEIEYEKKVNIYAKIANKASLDLIITEQFVQEYRTKMPQFYTEKKVLKFSPSGSLYLSEAQRKAPISVEAGEPWVIVENEVFNNFQTDSIFISKRIMGDEFSILDVRPKVTWRFTNEERDIAGFRCKRANGIYLDSIYVVAFYSETILPPGGPEGFSGLPGMILGLALPHENVSWFATKISERNVGQIKSPVIPSKKQPLTKAIFEKFLKENTKNWKNYQGEALKAFSF